MKKLLVFMMLLALGNSAFAQTGGLTIDNSQGKCAVWVKMLGTDPSVAGDGLCQLNSATFLVPAYTTWTFCSVWDFQGGPVSCTCGMSGTGVYAPGWAFGNNIPCASTTFQWTDVTFQWNNCGDCNGGSSMSIELAS